MNLTASEHLMYAENRDKFLELCHDKQWAGLSWHEACWQRGLKMKVMEVGRTQDRQVKLFAQGRDKQEFENLLRYGLITRPQYEDLCVFIEADVSLPSEERVTWTLNSFHTKGLAADVKPINCSFAEISAVASEFGITHPLPRDQWHFEFDKAKGKPLSLSLGARLDRLKRAVARAVEPLKGQLQRQRDRLLNRQ